MMKNNILTICLIIILLLAPLSITLAGTAPDSKNTITFGNPLGKTNPSLFEGTDSFAYRAIVYFLGFVGIIAVIMIIYSGLLMISAVTDKERFAKGLKSLIYAIIGLVVILMSFVILSYVRNTIT